MRVELIYLIHLIKQRKYCAELIIVFVMACACKYRAEFICSEEAYRRPLLAAVRCITGWRLLHPANTFGQTDSHYDSCPCNLGRQYQIFPARNDIQNRQVQAVTAVTAYVFWIIIMIAGPGIAEYCPLRFPVGLHIFYISLIEPGLYRIIQTEIDFRIFDDRVIHLVPELREGISLPGLAAVLIIHDIQPVLKQLLISVRAFILEFSVLHNKSPNLVKVPIQLICAQAEETFKKILFTLCLFVIHSD